MKYMPQIKEVEEAERTENELLRNKRFLLDSAKVRIGKLGIDEILELGNKYL